MRDIFLSLELNTLSPLKAPKISTSLWLLLLFSGYFPTYSSYLLFKRKVLLHIAVQNMFSRLPT